MQRARAITPERAFLGIAIIFGLVYVMLIPPFQATDEPQHFFRAYQLSQGVMYSVPLPHGGIGGFIPRSFKYAANDLLYHPLSGISDRRFAKYFALKAGVTDETHFENTALYSPVAYLPYAAALTVFKAFNVGLLPMLYALRLVGLATGIYVLFLAIKITPVGKWGFFAVGVLPMTLYQMSTISADMLTITASLLLTALLLNVLVHPKQDLHTQMRGLAALSLIVFLTKPTYGVIVLALVSLRKKVSAVQRADLRVLGGAVLLGALLAGYWQIHTAYVQPAFQEAFRPGLNIAPAAQLHYLATHPVAVAKVTVGTLAGKDFALALAGLVGVFGWYNLMLPLWATMLSYAMVLLGFVLLGVTDGELPISRTIRLVFLGVFLIAIAGIMLALYATYTPLRAGSVAGMQGRYALPLIGLLAPVIVSYRWSLRGNRRVAGIVTLVLGSLLPLCSGLSVLFRHFY